MQLSFCAGGERQQVHLGGHREICCRICLHVAAILSPWDKKQEGFWVYSAFDLQLGEPGAGIKCSLLPKGPWLGLNWWLSLQTGGSMPNHPQMWIWGNVILIIVKCLYSSSSSTYSIYCGLEFGPLLVRFYLPYLRSQIFLHSFGEILIYQSAVESASFSSHVPALDNKYLKKCVCFHFLFWYEILQWRTLLDLNDTFI